MTSVVKVKRNEPKDKIAYHEAAVGDWYESHYFYGLCLKLSSRTFYSATLGQVVRDKVDPDWMCELVNVDIHPRQA